MWGSVMANTPKLLYGPAELNGSGVDTLIYLGTSKAVAGGNANLFDIVRHIHITANAALSVTLYLGTGTPGAGTSLLSAYAMAQYAVWDLYPNLKLLNTQAFYGFTNTAYATIMIEGETGVL